MTDTYRPLATVTLGSAASSVTFSSIPATYRDLIVVIEGTTATNFNLTTQVNSDTGNNYSTVEANGSSSGTQSFANTSLDRFYAASMQTARTNVTYQFMDYSATDKHKTVLVRNGVGGDRTSMVAGRWASTAAITSIFFYGGTFAAGSNFSLYGIAS